MTQGTPPVESAPSKRWYRRWWVWVLIAFGVLVVFSAISGGSDTESDEDAASTTTEATTTTTEATTTTTEATTTTTEATTTTLGIPGTLGMTPDEFRFAWNSIVDDAGLPELELPPLVVEEGEVQDVATAVVAPHISVLVTVNKADGSVRDVSVLAEASQDNDANAETLVSWGTLFRSSTVPPSGPEHAAEVFDTLGLLDGDFDDLDSEAVVGGVDYSAMFSSELGVFFVSAGDPSDTG